MTKRDIAKGVFEIRDHYRMPFGSFQMDKIEVFKRVKYVAWHHDFYFAFYDTNLVQLKIHDLFTNNIIPHVWKPKSKLELLNLVRSSVLARVKDDAIIAKIMLVGDGV